jgi:hypothetical protein
MSAIYFTSETHKARLSGAERAFMGTVIDDVAFSFMRGSTFDREYVNDFLNCFGRSLSYRPERLDDLKSSLRAAFFDMDRYSFDWFEVALNTVLKTGNDALQLFARLHGQCEIHAWIHADDKQRLVAIIEDGLDSGLYRQKMGWDSVIELLSTSEGNIYTSYSVCDSFPRMDFCDVEPEGEDQCYYEERKKEGLSPADIWRQNVAYMDEHGKGLRIDPNQGILFGDGKTIFDLDQELASYRESHNAAPAQTKTALEAEKGNETDS